MSNDSDSEDKARLSKLAWDSYPPELLTRIFSQLTIFEKKKSRLVCSYWRNVMDTHPNVTFKVRLKDKTANWVKNMSWDFIECLIVEHLTTEFNMLDLVSIPKILHIGPNNSQNNFWNALKYFNIKQGEHLEFEKNSLKFFDDLSSEDLPNINLTSVKTLEVCVPNRINAAINFFNVITLPSLEELSLEFAFHHLPTVYQFLSRHNSITSTKFKQRGFIDHLSDKVVGNLTNVKLKELELDLDFAQMFDVSLLIEGCNKLKGLCFISQKYGFIPESFRRSVDGLNLREQRQRGHDMLLKLIHKNSTTLESLSLKSCTIDFTKLQLQDCTSLKVLEFRSVLFQNIPKVLKLPTVRRLSLENMINITLPLIKEILNMVKDGLEELTLDFYDGFDILQLQNILIFPKISKLILVNIHSTPPLIRHYCNETYGLKSCWVRNKLGRYDYCVTQRKHMVNQNMCANSFQVLNNIH